MANSSKVQIRDQLSLVMLKPDCLHRDLVEQAINMILKTDVRIILQQRFPAHESQVFRHYESLVGRFGETGKQQLRQIYEGQEVIILLVQGQSAVSRMRALVGAGDPAKADGHTVRGRLGDDSFARARKEGRLVNNLIHASDSLADARREFRIWFNKNLEDYVDF